MCFSMLGLQSRLAADALGDLATRDDFDDSLAHIVLTRVFIVELRWERVEESESSMPQWKQRTIRAGM